MAEARALRLCTKGDYIKSGQRDDKSPLKGAWFCSRDLFLYAQLIKLGMVKPEIMLCETVLNLSTLRYFTLSAISGNVTSRHRARETVELLKMETPDFISPMARM